MILVASEEGGAGFAQAARMLRDGCGILDTIEAGIRAAEVDPAVTSVGLGGRPNAAGFVELDAGMMDGATLKSGAVGGLVGCAHPISIARVVHARSPHELLVGDGARRFAREVLGEESVGLPPHAEHSGPLLGASGRLLEELRSHDTVVLLGADAGGHFGAGASTSGLAGKYPGRVGDSAIVGAGFYAEDAVGAAGCTGIGEMSMRTGLARLAIEHMRAGAPVAEAVEQALRRVGRLAHGLIGAITLLAVDRHGTPFVGTLRGQARHYFVADRDGARQAAVDLALD